MTHDLVVVGGGPVGVTVGLFAAHRGLDVVVVERETAVHHTARAIGLDGEVHRLFQIVGLADQISAITTPMPGAEFVRPEGDQIMGAALPMADDTPFGFPIMSAHFQPELEAALREAAVGYGAELRLGTEVTQVTTVGDEVHTSITAPGMDGVLASRWAVAADGASSSVRKSHGMRFVDLGFDQEWLVVDVRLGRDTDVTRLPTFAQQICDPQRPTTFVPGHDRYRRWEFQLQPDDDRERMTDPATVWSLLAPWLSPEEASLERAVVYRFHATVADRWRDGPVFLAGDAAHQMPPFLGQGLNSGMRDAVNLVWKLDAVRRGVAGDHLLDSYEAERAPHVTDMAAFACDTGRLIDQFAGRVDSDVDEQAAYGGSRPFPFIEHGVRWGDHPMVGRPLPQPRVAGERLDTRLGSEWTILTDAAPDVAPGAGGAHGPVPADVASAWSRIGLEVVPLGDGWRAIPFAPESGAIFVRPDRTVAAVAADPAGVEIASASLLSWFD